MMNNSDADSSTGPNSGSSAFTRESPRNWRDQADGFADDEVESPAVAHDEPTRQWSTLR